MRRLSLRSLIYLMISVVPVPSLQSSAVTRNFQIAQTVGGHVITPCSHLRRPRKW